MKWQISLRLINPLLEQMTAKIGSHTVENVQIEVYKFQSVQ
jgi:hypothetical protein